MFLSTSRALPHTLRAITRSHTITFSNIRRSVSTLKENPNIYIHPPTSSSPQNHTLTLLPTTPPTASLSLGTTTTLPITPQSFTPNPRFLPFLSTILQKYAHLDPQLHSQAAAFATTTTHFSLSPPSSYRQNKGGKSSKGKDSGAPPSASQGIFSNSPFIYHTLRSLFPFSLFPSPQLTPLQGGAGSGGHGGYIHLSDTRAPPDYGRIAYPEDIFGSLEVDATGQFVEGDSGKAPGNWQDSGTYRIVTREGIFGLPDFLRGKLVEALKEEEKKINGN